MGFVAVGGGFVDSAGGGAGFVGSVGFVGFIGSSFFVFSESYPTLLL